MTTIETYLTAMVEAIVEVAQPERIILFGSLARGNHAPESDVDLLVIESEPFGPHRSRFQEIASLERAMGSIPVATDILVYTTEEVARLQSSANHTRCARSARRAGAPCPIMRPPGACWRLLGVIGKPSRFLCGWPVVLCHGINISARHGLMDRSVPVGTPPVPDPPPGRDVALFWRRDARRLRRDGDRGRSDGGRF